MNALYEETQEILTKYHFTQTFETLIDSVGEAIERHVQSVWFHETEQAKSRDINTAEIRNYLTGRAGLSQTIEWLQGNPHSNLCQWLYTLGTALKLQVVEREYTSRHLAIADWKFINEE